VIEVQDHLDTKFGINEFNVFPSIGCEGEVEVYTQEGEHVLWAESVNEVEEIIT
tara:strand:- start:351 stop:512 length:162 start_codon:yes stop_codon:yes gene_type:complete